MTPEELRELLVAAHEQVDETLRSQWQRSLSFEDGMFDRWERARRLQFAEGASVYNSAMVLEPVSVGEGTWIGPWTILDGSGGGITIGAWCAISAGAHLYTHDTVRWALSGGLATRETGAITIGDCCYVGPQAIVTAGVSVGDHSVIGANSLVRHDVPPRTVVAGSPARPIGRVEGDGDDVRIVTTGHPDT